MSTMNIEDRDVAVVAAYQQVLEQTLLECKGQALLGFIPQVLCSSLRVCVIRDKIIVRETMQNIETASLVLGNRLAIPLKSGSLDLVVVVDELCGKAELKEFLREIYRVLTPNGQIVVLNPQISKLKLFSIQFFKHAPPEAFAKSTLLDMLHDLGFKVEEVRNYSVDHVKRSSQPESRINLSLFKDKFYFVKGIKLDPPVTPIMDRDYKESWDTTLIGALSCRLGVSEC